MITRLLAPLLVVVPVAADAQAGAEPLDGRIELIGEAPSACVVRGPEAAVGVNATFAPLGASAGQVRITELVDPATALPRAASMDLAMPVICNGPHRVVVRSANGGLRRDGQPAIPGPFAEFVAYQLNSAWGDQSRQLDNSGNGPLIIDSATARAGSLLLSINLVAGGRPLVAGNYQDQIVVEVQAAN